MRKFQIFSSFTIKLFAFFFMTLDHIGMFLTMFHPYEQAYIDIANIFRTTGRLAMPLFIFMIVEGAIHTKNMKAYLIRLGVMAVIISTALIVLAYTQVAPRYSSMANFGNIFLDLFLAALTIWLLKQENNYLKLLILLPIAISIISFIIKGMNYDAHYNVYWYPSFLFMQYDFISLLLAVGFYYSYKLSDWYIAYLDEKGYSKLVWTDGNKRLLISLVQFTVLIIVSIFHYLFVYMWPSGVYWHAKNQLACLLAGALFLLYNGKRGYNAKWFQYGSYLYYPLHIVIIFAIFILINGGI